MEAIIKSLNFDNLWAEVLKFFDTLAEYLKDMVTANF